MIGIDILRGLFLDSRQQRTDVVDNNGKGSKKISAAGKHGKILPDLYHTQCLLKLALILCAGNHDRTLQVVNDNGGSQESKRESPGSGVCVLYTVAIHPTACCLRTCETNMKIAHVP